MSAEPAPASPVGAALARLQASRTQLRRALAGDDPVSAPRWRGGRSLLRGLRPLRPLRRLLLNWWTSRSWRPAAELALGAAQAQLGPVVRRHPWLSVGAAAALGAALAQLRPWRWPLLTRQAALWRGAALGAVAAELARPENQAALLGALLAASHPHAAEAADDGAGPQPESLH